MFESLALVDAFDLDELLALDIKDDVIVVEKVEFEALVCCDCDVVC